MALSAISGALRRGCFLPTLANDLIFGTSSYSRNRLRKMSHELPELVFHGSVASLEERKPASESLEMVVAADFVFAPFAAYSPRFLC